MQKIEKETTAFLRLLSKHNDREWFEKNKSKYLIAKENIDGFAQSILDGLSTTDLIETSSGKKAVYRIYRDVRFSKDKSPYKKHFAAYFRRATEERRGGYYLRIEPGDNSLVGGGFWGPSKEDLKLIRDQVSMDADPLRKVLRSKKFKSHFDVLVGEKLKTAPKGFPKDHPEIDLLNHKQFLVHHSFSDEEVIAADFGKKVLSHFKAMRPFFDVMSMYLTTDLNGESLI